MSKNILTNLQLRVLAISQSLINVHINLIMNNSAHFLKSTPPRAFGVSF